MARQYLIPGQGYINEITTRQFLVAGWGYLNSKSSSSTSSSAATEGADVLAATATLTFTLSGAVVESGDSPSSTSTETFVFSGAIVESGDSPAAISSEGFVALSSINEGSDSLDASDLLTFIISGAFVEGADGLSGSGTYTPGSFTSSSAVTEGADILAASVTIATSTGTLIESSDTVNASVIENFEFSGSVVEGADGASAHSSTLSSSAKRQFLVPGQGYVNSTQFRQYLIPGFGYFNDSVPITASGSAAITEGADFGTGSITQGINSGAMTEGADVLAANGTNSTSSITGSAAITEGADTAFCSVNEVLTYKRQFLIPGQGYINLTARRQYLVAGFGYINDATPQSANANAASTEGADILIASGSNILIPISSSGAVTEGADTAAGGIAAGSGVSANIFEASDIVGAHVSSYSFLTSAITESSDIISAAVASHAPTTPNRIFAVPEQPVFFLTTLVNKIAYKTVAEIDLYSIDFTAAIGSDTVLFSQWNSPDGLLDIIAPITPLSNNISSSLIGGGGSIPSSTMVLCGVQTSEQRELEDSITFYIQQFNLIPDTVIDAGASDILDYRFDWTARMIDDDEVITSSSWAFDGYDSALSLSPFPSTILSSPQATVVWVTGGTYQQGYTITNTIQTSYGRTLQCSLQYFINNPIIMPGIEDIYISTPGDDPYVTEDESNNYVAN